jgi:two-component system chemotaxis response regulator CheB
MVVDDSAIVRGMLNRRLSEQPDFTIAVSAVDGQMAIDALQSASVDVIILDLEMPRMDGFTALPEIRRLAPRTPIIISSTFTERNADAALRALAMGANDYVSKPSARQDRGAGERFYVEMVDKIRALTGRSAVVAAPAAAALAPAPQAPVESVTIPKPPRGGTLFTDGTAATSFTGLMPATRPAAVAIASSTGGPQALLQIFGALGRALESVPVFITQHMPPTFTSILAKHIEQASGAASSEAKEGENVQPGRIYIAPGDYHMRIRKEAEGAGPRICLTQDPPINFCRPAADPMIASLVEIYGNRLLLLVLTGMGHDGLEGARLLAAAGGTVIAQDKASSTVWGMPKAVAEHGHCKGLLALPQIAPYLQMVFGGAR